PRAPPIVPSPRSLHDALPICPLDCLTEGGREVERIHGLGDVSARASLERDLDVLSVRVSGQHHDLDLGITGSNPVEARKAVELKIGKHTSELQSRSDLVCRLL